ncbi:phenazine biosynthesis protein PhzF [Chromatiales bacterium (ex Bugula neritina AB1)]|nr:phenazine biosynthesis protein PhzF [Chromatiales bacterium (ex Bugula neritina AB1)]
MAQRRFIQCDVFSSVATKGNGLAVVVDAVDLSDDQMAAFAAWTNLAETTFLFPPDHPEADYRVRIMTPTREMPFAGHPTLGSCAAWLRCGGKPKDPSIVRQECGVGLVEIDLTGRFPAFIAPETHIEPIDQGQLAAISSALEINLERIVHTAKLSNGPVWQLLELSSAEDVLALDSSRVKWPAFQAIGLLGAHQSTNECDYEVRMLAPSSGMSEDPITGSLNSAIAVWLNAQGRLESEIVVAQGTVIGRHGRVYIRKSDSGASEPGRIRIGGQTQILIEGTVEL